MNHICLNGKILPEEEPALLVSNRGYRYGDGLFETMRMKNGELLLKDYHFNRLLNSCSLLHLELPAFFSPEILKKDITRLCQKNNCTRSSRIRLSVFRGNGGLYDADRALEYVIEAWPLTDQGLLNENGLVIDIYTRARKSKDPFSNLKSANFLPYTMAAIHAREHQLNDCLVLNTDGNVADATIANVFVIKNKKIFTPALGEACVDGVMRRYLIDQLTENGIPVHETSVSPSGIENADEVFLTNAIQGIRWVKQLRDKIFTNTQTTEIYNQFIKTISS